MSDLDVLTAVMTIATLWRPLVDVAQSVTQQWRTLYHDLHDQSQSSQIIDGIVDLILGLVLIFVAFKLDTLTPMLSNVVVLFGAACLVLGMLDLLMVIAGTVVLLFRGTR